MSAIRGASVLVTGGTGSFGHAFVRHALDYGAERVVVYSRDEFKQYEMQRSLPDDRLRFFIGDVRDAQRLTRAMEGVDIVVHAAALKHVPVCEYNPFEAVKTNVLGTQNVVEAAMDTGVRSVVALSSDKAAAPANLYGATKLTAERLVTAAENYKGSRDVRFSAVRYGNVFGSRGSVVPLFLKQRDEGRLTITDPGMTRFSMTPEEAISLVAHAIRHAEGGEVFVSKCPSYDVMTLAAAIAPDVPFDIVGMRQGEHLHEVMLTADECATDTGAMYVIRPDGQPSGIRYDSGTNPHTLTVSDIRRMVREWVDPTFEV